MNRTKKVMAAILLSSLVFIAGCAPEALPEAEPESLPEIAVNSKIVYENEELGIRMELPEGWVNDMDDELAKGSVAYIKPEGFDHFSVALYVVQAYGRPLQDQVRDQEIYYEYMLEEGEISRFGRPEETEASEFEAFYVENGSTVAIEHLEKRGDFFITWRFLLDNRIEEDALTSLIYKGVEVINNSYI